MLIRGGSWPGLLSKVKQHRRANGYPMTIEMERQVEAFMCEAQPGGCVEVDDEPPRTFRFSEVIAFTGLMLESIFTGSPRASASEASRRGEICSNCPDNIEVTGTCTGCSAGAVQRMLEKVCGKESTEYDDKLHSCRHCGCLNKAQIWFPLGLLQRHTSVEVDEALPSHCWKKQ